MLSGASLVAQMVKNLRAVQETRFDPWMGKVISPRNINLVFIPGLLRTWKN